MLIYWVMFAIPAFAAVLPVKFHRQVTNLAWLLVALFFVVVMGFRFETGADWSIYMQIFYRTIEAPLIESLKMGDPAYVLINWIVAHMGVGMYGVNLICSALFISGLVYFCRRQPNPWLAFVVAVPILVNVISIGYVRQATAMSFEFFALGALIDGRVRHFVIFVAIGALLHASAVSIFPLLLLLKGSSKYLKMLFGGILIFTGFFFVHELNTFLWYFDFYSRYSLSLDNTAALTRILMSALPAIIFLAFRDQLSFGLNDSRLWWGISVLSIISTFIVMFMSSATLIIDRLAIYLMPIQLVVFPRLLSLFRPGASRGFVMLLIIAGYALVQFVWLNYGKHIAGFVPYMHYSFDELFLPYKCVRLCRDDAGAFGDDSVIWD